jgi:hypothetical protein
MLCLLALAASRYQGGPQAGDAFRKSMKLEGWEPDGSTSSTSPAALNEATQRGVVGFSVKVIYCFMHGVTSGVLT